jgi:hypothetical protein
MSTPGLPANVRVIETPRGVCYRYTWHKGYWPPALGLTVAVAVVPLAAGVLAVSFLVRHVAELPAALTALGLLFPAQMAFLARRPLWFLGHSLWQALAVALGNMELAVEGRWLVVGSRLGPLRRRWRRPVPEVRQLTVYVYRPAAATSGGATPEPAPQESACLAAEFPDAAPWLMVDGLARGEALALAEGLNARLAAASADAGTMRPLPPVAVVETTHDALYPSTRAAGPSRRRILWWLAWHLAGCVGLGALWFAASQTADAENPYARSFLLVAMMFEFVVVGVTLKLLQVSGRRRRGAQK